ncbi:Hypothetical predicted protein [Pelobates cultripes]|uniref:Uncharacterized protein n=1 Tax=Pelobates cultripes TaxID=61616 RepID=A0AAD1SGH8_PELCU|nr:Hypothetical predicted protein [Pelobates cultripes]
MERKHRGFQVPESPKQRDIRLPCEQPMPQGPPKMAPAVSRTETALEESLEEEESLTSPRQGDLHREAESDDDSSPATKQMLLEMRQIWKSGEIRQDMGALQNKLQEVEERGTARDTRLQATETNLDGVTKQVQRLHHSGVQTQVPQHTPEGDT